MLLSSIHIYLLTTQLAGALMFYPDRNHGQVKEKLLQLFQDLVISAGSTVDDSGK
jgi:hypothetical protein